MLTEKCDWGASLAASLLAKCLSNGAWFSKNATRRTFGTTEVKALLTGTRSLNGGAGIPVDCSHGLIGAHQIGVSALQRPTRWRIVQHRVILTNYLFSGSNYV